MNVRRVFHILQFFFSISFVKTLKINIWLLPFSKAVRLPIIVYGKTSLCLNRNSKVVINCHVQCGLLKIGYVRDHQISKYTPSHFLLISGTLVLNGYVDVSPGCTIRIDGGYLTLGEGVFLGSGSKLLCNNRITIGNNTWIPFNNIVTDTDFHYLNHNGIIKRCNGEVVIGDNVWIGNSSTIHKAKLPDNSIVASNSLVNKDFRSEENATSGILLAGVPAKIIGCGYDRISSKSVERILNDFFSHNNVEQITISELKKIQ